MSDYIFTGLRTNRVAVLLTAVYNLINFISVGEEMDIAELTSDLKELYLKLNAIGCCTTCCLRFRGETCPEPFKRLSTQLTKVGKLSM